MNPQDDCLPSKHLSRSASKLPCVNPRIKQQEEPQTAPFEGATTGIMKKALRASFKRSQDRHSFLGKLETPRSHQITRAIFAYYPKSKTDHRLIRTCRYRLRGKPSQKFSLLQQTPECWKQKVPDLDQRIPMRQRR